MISKEQLIKDIKNSFKNVRLEDGIGLWEAQGLDDRLTAQECRKLRVKDEKENWKKIPLIDLYQCSSSLSFFDAKGIRFHLPIFLLFAIIFFEENQKELLDQGLLDGCSEPDIEFHLADVVNKNEIGSLNRKYYKEHYSLLTIEQLKCIKWFLEYRMNELEKYYADSCAKNFGTSPDAVKFDKDYILLEKGVEYWAKEITTANDL